MLKKRNQKVAWSLLVACSLLEIRLTFLFVFQACTEMAMPMCADGVTDMFEPAAWNFKAFSDGCYKKWKVRPQRDWIITHYADKNIRAASNIVFRCGKDQNDVLYPLENTPNQPGIRHVQA
jgi:hypothetical protein